MGPSSSASQATVASVVTSTLLAGLGISGGVISSLPSSVGPTQAPQSTQNPTSSSATVKTSTEQAAPAQDSKTNSGGKQEGEEEENEEDGDGEQDEGQDEKKKKNKMATDTNEKQANSTVANEPEISTPASTSGDDAGGRPTVGGSTAPVSPNEQLVKPEKNLTDVNTAPTQEPRNDSAEIQIPQSSTVSTKINSKGSEGKNAWPFFVHTGEHPQTQHNVFSFAI